MNLIVDVGNTLVKFAVYKNANLKYKTSFELSEFKTQYQLIKTKYPKLKSAII
jgi:type III pantothenate kinase